MFQHMRRSPLVSHSSWLPTSMLTLLICFSTGPLWAVDPTDLTCGSGTAIPRADMSVLTASGGWLTPVTDAARMIDGAWSGWAPNYGPEATATVALGATYSLSEVRLLTDTSQGNVEFRLPGGAWQTISYSVAFTWHALAVSGTANQIELRRNGASDNVIELVVCGSASAAVTVSIGDASVDEEDGYADFTVSLSAASDEPISVDFWTQDASATSPEDFVGPNPNIRVFFSAGETTKIVSVAIVDDLETEPDETFFVHLADVTGAILGSAQGLGTIRANDDPPEPSGCSIPADTPTIEVGQDDSSSLWVSLTSDPAVIAALTGVEVTVLQNATIGNELVVVGDWEPSPSVSGAADSSTFIPVPSGLFSGSIQGYVSHVPGSVYKASLTLCTDDDTDFEDLAKLAPGVNPCSSSWTADGCYNADLPPRPSTMRSQVVNKTHTGFSPGHDIQHSNTKWWGSDDPSSSPQTWQLGTRSTLDGRINILNYGPAGQIGAFYPENLGYGFQTKYDVAGNQLEVLPKAAQANVYPWMRISHQTGLSGKQLADQDAFYGGTGGTDLCNAGEASLPYACLAFNSDAANAGPREGSCYDIYFISTFPRLSEDHVVLMEMPEIRSTAVTVFVENAEWIPRPGESITRGIWIYPRTASANASVDSKGRKLLPDFLDYFGLEEFNMITAASPWLAAQELETDCASEWHGYCDFFNDQTHTDKLLISVQGETGTKLGSPTKFLPIELSTTGDGRVLVGNDAREGGIGFFYAYSPDPCDASGWTTFKPLTEAYYDSDVKGRYGFAEYPVTYPDGTKPPRGERVGAAYPWIDRAGANIFLGGHAHTFGWKACDMDEGSGEPAAASFCVNDVSAELNAKNAKSPKVFGLWTRGKIVHLDGVMHGSDWTARANPQIGDDRHFFVAAFRDAPWEKVRPGNNTDFFTFENLFNHLDHMTPLYPNDVVWTVTAGKNHVNGEVPFDDYLTEGGLVLAPMIDRLEMVPDWVRSYAGSTVEGVHANRRANGMDQATFACTRDTYLQHPDCPQMSTKPPDMTVTVLDLRAERYVGTGIFLQNNANPDGVLPVLSLRGGAFIPPISTGVMGKAVYIDGINDRIEIDHLPGNVSSYYLGVWVHPETRLTRTLFQFPDESVIRISHNSIWFVQAGGEIQPDGCYVGGDVQIQNTDIPEREWTHLGFAFSSGGYVDTYVNGTRVASHDISNGFSFAPQAGKQLTLGQDRDHCQFQTTYQPFDGWVDELKIFKLADGQYYTNELHERACNHALGSLRTDGTCEQIDFRQNEDLDIYGAGSGLEFPLAAYVSQDCGSSVHRNYRTDAATGCDRSSRLGIPALDPGEPRPAFNHNGFCLSCHSPGGPRRMNGDDIVDFDLSTMALVHEPWHDATDDRRRQPMFWHQQFDHILWNGTRNEQIGCGVGFHEVGRFATLLGKVNVHRDVDGPWSFDDDCSSGANIKDLAYCKKFWPDADSLHRTVLSPEKKPFVRGGGSAANQCGGEERYSGREEWVCCAEDP